MTKCKCKCKEILLDCLSFSECVISLTPVIFPADVQFKAWSLPPACTHRVGHVHHSFSKVPALGRRAFHQHKLAEETKSGRAREREKERGERETERECK